MQRFWRAKEILLIDYLPKNQTINGQYYAKHLNYVDKKNHEKRPGLRKKIMIHKKNTCLSTIMVAT